MKFYITQPNDTQPPTATEIEYGPQVAALADRSGATPANCETAIRLWTAMHRLAMESGAQLGTSLVSLVRRHSVPLTLENIAADDVLRALLGKWVEAHELREVA